MKLLQLILIIFPCGLFAQNTIVNDISFLRKNILKIGPGQLVNSSNPGIEIAFERFTGERFSSQIVLNYLTINDIYEGEVERTGGYRIAFEEKYYVPNYRSGGFIALELDFFKNGLKTSETFTETFINDQGMQEIREIENDYVVKRDVFSVNFKLGKQFNYSRFIFTIYGGFGLRFKNIYEEGRIGEDEDIKGSFFSLFSNPNLEPGKTTTISLPLNIRVGYTF